MADCWIMVEGAEDYDGASGYVWGLYRTAGTALRELREDVLGDEHYAALWWYPDEDPGGAVRRYVGWHPGHERAEWTVERHAWPEEAREARRPHARLAPPVYRG